MNRVISNWKNPLEFVMPSGEFIKNFRGRQSFSFSNSEFRDEAFEQFGLKNVETEPMYQNFIGNHFLEGAYTHLHRDKAPEGKCHVRVNWMIKKPPQGGNPVLANRVYPVNEGDLWICFASEEFHASTPIFGGERVICSFGGLVDRQEALKLKESICMSQPDIKIGCVANLYSRMMHFRKAGDIEEGHAHQFDHLTLLAKGKLKVTVDGKTTEFVAPHMIYIHKDKFHVLEALTDETVAYCIHALRDKETNDILDPDMIPEGVDPLLYADRIAN